MISKGEKWVIIGFQIDAYNMYLFCSRETVDVFSQSAAIYGISTSPDTDKIFTAAYEDGRVLLYDKRCPASEGLYLLAKFPRREAFRNCNIRRYLTCLKFNFLKFQTRCVWRITMQQPCMRASSIQSSRAWLQLRIRTKGSLCGTCDNRASSSQLKCTTKQTDFRLNWFCRSVVQYGGCIGKKKCMSVRISRDGRRAVGLRRRLPPVLYDLHSPRTVCSFDHAGYYNSCTMKSCCFAGDRDQV